MSPASTEVRDAQFLFDPVAVPYAASERRNLHRPSMCCVGWLDAGAGDFGKAEARRVAGR